MEKSFDFGALLKNNQKKHKSKPAQFGSVASGVKQRLENNIKTRKNTRFTVFDKVRDLPECDSPSPAPLTELQLKAERRRLQLEKWKEEKEKKKREAAAQKKKPFLTGVAHAPLRFVPPPIPPKLLSGTGRVTRSQTAKNKQTIQKSITNPKQTSNPLQSFAPVNAIFRPPEIISLKNLPNLPEVNRNKKDNPKIMFNPVLPANQAQSTSKQTRFRAAKNKQAVTETHGNKNVIPKIVLTPPSSDAEMAVSTTKTLQKSQKSSNKGKKRIVSKKNIPKSESMTEARLRSPRSPNEAVAKSNSHFDLPLEIENNLHNSESSENILTENSKSSMQDFSGKTKLTDVPLEKVEPNNKFESEMKSSSPKDSLKTPEQIIKEPNRISPCVTLSRGKDNARREMKKKIDEGLLDEDASDMNNVDDFRHQLDSEVKRMMEMCDTWDKIMEQTQLPDNVQEAALAATGQARLLVSAKLQQFAALLERCARPAPGHPLVTPADLSGFWDMVFMQIEDIDMRFKKLEQLRSHGWEEEQTAQQKKKVAPARTKKSNKPAPGPSRLREMIAAARKAKKEQEAAGGPLPPTPRSSKTFEGGFFSVQSPVRASPPPPPLPASPAFALARTPPSLLKKVLSNEAKKYSASKSPAYAILRASSFSKSIEIEGIAPLQDTPKPTPNAHITPSRSILKSTNVASVQKSGKKSVKVVLFNNHDNDLDNSLAEKEKSSTDENTGQKEEEKISDQSKTEEETHVTSATSMDIQKESEKENINNKLKLIRQDAFEERSPVMTRSRRKSLSVAQVGEAKSPRRSARKSAGQARGAREAREAREASDAAALREVQLDAARVTRRSSRTRKSVT